MRFNKDYQFLITELNKNRSKIIRVFFTILISFLIFSSVIILKNSIESEIKKNSRVMLGGDLELSSKNKKLDSDAVLKFGRDFFVTEVIEFTSIIRANSEQTRTARIKVIDNSYPLVGEVKVEPRNALKILKEETDTILIDQTTKRDLGIGIGDKIKIQTKSLRVIGVIESLPDLGGFFLFGNQALINNKTFENLEINSLGNFLDYKYKMTARNKNLELPQRLISNTDMEIKFPDDAARNLKKTIENFLFFLSIISASAILISGIGLTNSLFSFLSSNQLKIAIYKSLGLSSNNIKKLYYLQALIILIICSFISYILGLFIISSFNHFFLSSFNIDLDIKFKIHEFLTIHFFSIIIFFAFAKPVLNSIDQVRVADLFRNSSSNLNLNYNRKSILEIFTFLLIFIVSFCFLNVKPRETAIFFFFFSLVGSFYYFLSRFYISFLSKIRNSKNLSIKMGIKNLSTYRSLNSIVIMTMGLGMTILLFLGILSSNINNELNSSVSKKAPHFFFLGIKKNELDSFSNQIYEIDNEAEQIIVPIISARIEGINDRDPMELISENNKSWWFINGERRISWTMRSPTNNQIVEGQWWDSDENKELKLSLDSEVAKNLRLKIGDNISFNIYGNKVTGIITNFRKVDYSDLNINFAILFNPSFASNIPHEFMSTVKFEDEDKVSLNNLLTKLPNITYIKVSEYIKKTKSFLNKLFVTSIIISSMVIIIGLIVISNAISVIGKLKLYQNLVLRILGLEKSSITILILFESLVLFIPIIFFSLLFATLFSFIFITNIFNINWYFSLSVLLFVSSSFLSVLVLTLFISNGKFLNFNTYTMLRNN